MSLRLTSPQSTKQAMRRSKPPDRYKNLRRKVPSRDERAIERNIERK